MIFLICKLQKLNLETWHSNLRYLSIWKRIFFNLKISFVTPFSKMHYFEMDAKIKQILQKRLVGKRGERDKMAEKFFTQK